MKKVFYTVFIALIGCSQTHINGVHPVEISTANRWVTHGDEYDAGLIIVANCVIKWNRKILPIGVFFEPGLPEDIMVAYRLASTELNGIIGAPILSLGSIWQNGEVPRPVPVGFLMVRSCKELPCEDVGGSTTHNLKEYGQIISSEVRIQPGLGKNTLLAIMRHELGHVLGLAHDKNPISIMNPHLNSAFVSDKIFTKNDVELLREIYR